VPRPEERLGLPDQKAQVGAYFGHGVGGDGAGRAHEPVPGVHGDPVGVDVGVPWSGGVWR